MHAPCSYDYAVIRVVPRVERQEFVNAGVILWCRERDFIEARIEVDETRLRVLDAAIDMEAVRRHLGSFAIIQTSAVHSGRCTDPSAAMERLLDTMVR